MGLTHPVTINHPAGERMNRSESGFTLVELLVSMAMAGIVVGIIYAAYTIQTRIYTEQGKVAEMQQNIRAAVTYLRHEGVMAGYHLGKEKKAERDVSCSADPSSDPPMRPGVHTATATEFGFSMDLNGDGKCDGTGENVTYKVYWSSDKKKWMLGRNAASLQPVAEDITHVQFVYLFEPPEIGSPAAATAKAPTSAPAVTELEEIAAVQVTLLARASAKDRKRPITQNPLAPVPDAWGRQIAQAPILPEPVTDSFSRRQLTTTINLRNMGL